MTRFEAVERAVAWEMQRRPIYGDASIAGVIMNGFFHRFARGAATVMGSHWAFIAAAVACLLWAVTGPAFHYSNTWQLVINTATTVMTFLAVFLIQNTQNRNDLAIQLKLDELLRAVETARTSLVDLEDSTDEEIDKLRHEFRSLRDGGAAPKP